METKQCTKCLEVLDLSNFHFVKSRGRHAARCKQCEKVQRRKYIKPHEAARRRHNFSDEQYAEIIAKAPNGCEICGSDMGDKICFDHCHNSGKFRGLLCHRCNTMLGLALDDISTLEKSILYLKTNS